MDPMAESVIHTFFCIVRGFRIAKKDANTAVKLHWCLHSMRYVLRDEKFRFIAIFMGDFVRYREV